MFPRRVCLLLLLGCCTLAAFAVERKIAGISLGMKPAQVFALLDEPTAILMAQPPIVVRSTGTGAMGGALGAGMGGGMTGLPGSEGQPEAERPNSLIFIYANQEIEIGSSTPDVSMAGMGNAMMGAPTTTAAARDAALPVWAYVVRATKLSLGQQELIYKINDTYSIGITITGQGAEAQVTDIVACSFEPFTKWPDHPTRMLDRKRVNFFYPTKSRALPAGTSKGVVIGSRLDEVMRAHGWPDYFFPFVADPVSQIILRKPIAEMKDVLVKSGGGAAGPSTAPAMPTGDMGGLGMLSGSAAGVKQVAFTDGDKMTLSAGFTTNALMLYLNDSVAITVVDFTVVRIQIGSGVVKPPDPPKTLVSSLGP